MKKTLITLTLLALFAAGCGQTVKKQAETLAGEKADSSRRQESPAIAESEESSANRFPLVTEADWEGVKCAE